LAKCSPTVAGTQQSWRGSNHYLDLFGAATPPASANLAVGKSGAAHRSQCGRSTAAFLQRENRLAGISRNQMGISKGLRYRESHNAIRSTVAAPDLSIAAISHLDATMSDIHHVRNVLNGSRHFCAAGTFCASFRHAMRQPTTCAPRAELLFMQVRTTSCAICRRGFCAPSEMRHALNDRPHERLSRHHIAPAPRKSAACTSSHGPVWLFILRCG